jgi:hypothetical protein
MAKDDARHAHARMIARFTEGVRDEAALLGCIEHMQIVDRLVPPAALRFVGVTDARKKTTVRVHYTQRNEESPSIGVHRHALTQMCTKVGIPLTYVNNLAVPTPEWRVALLCTNLNELFAKSFELPDLRFLHRHVGDELRAFLSRRYNRNLASQPMFNAFVHACRSVGAKPMEATASDIRFSLKYIIPQVFQPFPGEFLCVGVECANSDFGAGKLAISQTIWRLAAGTSIVLDESISRVHIGSVIESETLDLSDETAAKEVDTQASAIRDIVTEKLSIASLKALVEAVGRAHEEEISWPNLRKQLASIISKKEVKTLENLLDSADTIIDLPPPGTTRDGRRIPTKWWASSAVSYLAEKREDPDKKIELQHHSGRFLIGAITREKDEDEEE